jgi:hypothetical protein
MLNPNRVGILFSGFGVKCMIARPHSSFKLTQPNKPDKP